MQRKSGFLTFCFACLPGAGEMYLGYMKRGLSVMIAFWGLIFVASLRNMGILGILAPRDVVDAGQCPHRDRRAAGSIGVDDLLRCP